MEGTNASSRTNLLSEFDQTIVCSTKGNSFSNVRGLKRDDMVTDNVVINSIN